MLPLVVALLLLIPQSSRILGGEFVALGVAQGVALLLAGRGRKMTAEVLPSRLARVVLRFTATGTTTLLAVTSGLILLAGCSAGLYLLVPAVIFALIDGVWSAWLFLVPHQRTQDRGG